MKLNVFVPTFNRHHIIPTFLSNICKFFSSTNILARLIIVDATKQTLDLEAFDNKPSNLEIVYLHSRGCSFYRSMFVAMPYLIDESPIIFISDEEFGLPGKDCIDEFAISKAKIGVPSYVLSSRPSDHYTFLFDGWYQLNAIGKLQKLNPAKRLEIAKLFSNQGIVSYYQIYDHNHFCEMADFFKEMADLICTEYPNAERACETLWSISNLLSTQTNANFTYFRKLERREKWREIHVNKRFVEPVVHWLIWKKWKSENITFYEKIVLLCGRFWSSLSDHKLNKGEVELLINSHSDGYRLANSRRWRSGLDFLLLRDHKTVYTPQNIPMWAHLDHPYEILSPRLEFSVPDKIRFSDSWVTRKTSAETFKLLGVDFFFLDEDQFLLDQSG